MKQKRISAIYMRDGTRKGIFLQRSDLPQNDAMTGAGKWRVTNVLLGRCARRLMEGGAFVPEDLFVEHERGV